MSHSFYRAFEEKHRGARDLIKSRLCAYLPFVEPLVELKKGAQSIDLGCGRGEWIELMTELGFKAHGVDLDDDMLSGCVELGLSVEKGDAITFLAALPSDSHAVISAFHVVEHLKFEQLQTVVSEALRVLRPGGLLIMETPNPENIVVSTCNFYLDPTHQRPIPPELLAFLVEFHGFARMKTIRLHAPQSLMQSTSLTLHDILGGVSPDYAVVAQKAAAVDVFHRFDPAFQHEYGLSLATLTARYNTQIATQTQQTNAKAEEAVAKAEEAVAKAEEAVAKAELARATAEDAKVNARQLHQTLQATFNSRSWRITAPLRWCGLQVRRLREQGFLNRTKALTKKIIQPIVRRCITYVGAHPALKNQVVVLVQRVGLYQSLRRFDARPSGNGQPLMPNQPNELSQLTPRARKIYSELNSAIKNKQELR